MYTIKSDIKRKKSIGVTLIELLVSVSVLSIVSILIAQVFLTTTRVNRRNVSVQDIKSNGDFALDVIERIVRNAQEYAYTCDVGAQTTQTAAFVGSDLNTTTISCIEDGNILRIASISANGTYYLTGENVSLSNTGGLSCSSDSSLTFSCDALTGDGPLSVTFTLSSVGSSQERNTSTFTTSITPRNIQ